jgi:chromosome segregation ATPase
MANNSRPIDVFKAAARGVADQDELRELAEEADRGGPVNSVFTDDIRFKTEEERVEEQNRKRIMTYRAIQLANGIMDNFQLMQTTALDFLDNTIDKLRTEISDLEKERNDETAKLAGIRTQKAGVQDQIDRTQDELDAAEKDAVKTEQERQDIQEDIQQDQAALNADAQEQASGFRDDQGRLIVQGPAVNYWGDRQYFVQNEDGTLTSMMDLDPQERRALYKQIAEAGKNGETFAQLDKMLPPDQREALQQHLQERMGDLRENFSRRSFQHTHIRDLRHELKDLRDQLKDLQGQENASSERVAELTQQIEAKRQELQDAQDLSKDIRDGKYKTPEEINNAMAQRYGSEWDTYRDRAAYNSFNQREYMSTRFEQHDTIMALKQLDPNNPETAEQYNQLQQRQQALQAQLDTAAQVRQELANANYTPDDLDRIMSQYYGDTWAGYRDYNAQQQTMVASLQPAVLTNTDRTGLSAVDSGMGANGGTATAFNAAADPNVPAQTPELTPAVYTPSNAGTRYDNFSVA